MKNKNVSCRILLNEWKKSINENFIEQEDAGNVIIKAITTAGDIFNKEYSNTDSYDIANDCDVCQHSLSDFFVDMLRLRDQAHIYHWQTYSHSEHNSLEEYYEKYLDLIDDLAEIIMGALQERPSVEGISFELNDYSERNLQEYLLDAKSVFEEDAKEIIPEEYSEIHNKIEEVIEVIDKLSYMVTLR